MTFTFFSCRKLEYGLDLFPDDIEVDKFTYGSSETWEISGNNGYVCESYKMNQNEDGTYTVTLKFSQITTGIEIQ